MASQGDHVDSARILLYHKAPVDDVTVVSIFIVFSPLVLTQVYSIHTQVYSITPKLHK